MNSWMKQPEDCTRTSGTHRWIDPPTLMHNPAADMLNGVSKRQVCYYCGYYKLVTNEGVRYEPPDGASLDWLTRRKTKGKSVLRT